MKFFHNVTAKIAPAFSSKAALKSTAPQNKAPERTEKKVRSFRFFAAGLVLAAVSGLLGLCARTVPGFAQFYSVTVYPLLAGTLGRLCSLFPFSLSEIGLYSLCLFCICYMILHIRQPVVVFSRAFFLCCVLLFVFTINCGINYYRNPFSYEAGIAAEKTSTEELLAAVPLSYKPNQQLSDRNRPLRRNPGRPLPGTDRGNPRAISPGAFKAWKDGRAAWSGWASPTPSWRVIIPIQSLLSTPDCCPCSSLCGIYSPFTIEANYNREMPYYNIPHTICHELSHLKGFMREDEANFIGYLACIGSDSPDFRYSGYLTGWVYAGNALARVDPESYYDLYTKLSPQAAQDLAWNNQFWERFEGPVAEASTQMNDRYLKAHSQEDGVRSYGRMVDLMLAYYKDQLRED